MKNQFSDFKGKDDRRPLSLEDNLQQFMGGIMGLINDKAANPAWSPTLGRYLFFQVGAIPEIRVVPDLSVEKYDKLCTSLVVAAKSGMITWIIVCTVVSFTIKGEGFVAVYAEGKDRGHKVVYLSTFTREKSYLKFSQVKELPSENETFNFLEGILD